MNVEINTNIPTAKIHVGRDEILNAIIKRFKSQGKKLISVKDLDEFPSSYLMDNWDVVQKALNKVGIEIKTATKLAFDIHADIVHQKDNLPKKGDVVESVKLSDRFGKDNTDKFEVNFENGKSLIIVTD